MSKEQKKAIATNAQAFAGQAKASKAVKDFEEWRAKLKARAPRVAEAVCTPDLATPFHRPRATGGAQRSYACTRCGREALIPGFKRAPCKKKPDSVTAARFFTATLGKTAYDKSKAKKKAKYRANPEPQKQKRKETYQQHCESLRRAGKPKRAWVRKS